MFPQSIALIPIGININYEIEPHLQRVIEFYELFIESTDVEIVRIPVETVVVLRQFLCIHQRADTNRDSFRHAAFVSVKTRLSAK